MRHFVNSPVRMAIEVNCKGFCTMKKTAQGRQWEQAENESYVNRFHLQGLGRTLFERLQTLYGESISEMLNVQYRMHEDIMTWSSNELYGGKVTAHVSNAQHRLSDLEASFLLRDH